MNRFICILLLMILPVAATGQEDAVLNIPQNTLSWFNPLTNTDSLKALLAKKEGYEKIHILCELSYALKEAGASPAQYRSHLSDAWELSEILDYNNGRVMTLLLLTDYYRVEKNDPLQSLSILRQAETFFDDDTHWTLKYRIWRTAWLTMIQINQMDSAVLYYRKPLELLDKDTAWRAHLSAHLWLMRYAIINHNHRQKKEHYEPIFSILQNHDHLIAYRGFDLPSIYEELSIIMANDGEYKQALTVMLDLLDNLVAVEEKSLFTEFFVAKILGRIARVYSHWGRYDLALNYFNESIQYFDKVYLEYKSEIGDPGISPGYRLWSINAANQLEERAAVLIRTGELAKAKEDLMQSIQIRTEQNDPLGVAMSYEKLGELYAIRGKFMEALNWYNASLELKDEVLNKEAIRTRRDAKFVLFASESYASTCLKVGKLYKDWDKPLLAKKHYSESLKLSRDAGFQRCEAEALTAMGDLFLTMNQPDSTIAYYSTAKAIYEKMDYKPGLAEIHESSGDFFSKQTIYSEAVRSYIHSQRIFEELDMPANVAAVLIKQGKIFQENQNLQQAIARYEEGLGIAKRIHIPKIKMDAYQNLSEIYFSLDVFDKAFLNYKNFQEIKDELFTLETSRYLAELEAQYETEQNRQELLLLQREKELMEQKETRSKLIIFLMVGFIVIMLLWILLYLRHSKLKNGHEKIQLQQKLFRSQMNPHFIFNSLGSIQSSIMNDEPDKAVKYLSRFSKLMRNVLDSSDSEKIPLSKELSTIENYLELQKVRFPHKFDYLISVDGLIDPDTIFIPPMLAQPFIENAIEHGIKTMETKGIIGVSIQQSNDILTIEIEDNGIGRKIAGELLQKQDKDHKSMAIEITRRRIDVINRKLRRSIHFNIIDLTDEKGMAKGTKIVFVVPV